LLRYRSQQKYFLHEFVVMPDHVHPLITPTGITVERAVQYVKGAFSRELAKQARYRFEVWQTSFQDRRIRGAEEASAYGRYIRANPVKAGVCETEWEYPQSSAFVSMVTDPLPQGLKPSELGVAFMQA
jgi:putative transposase